MQAIGIVRVSTAEQAHEERYSIPHQRSHIAEECHRRALDLAHIFEFVQSGAKVLSSSGQERQKILEYIKDYGTGVVVVHELDRLARSMLDTLLFVDELNKLGVAFISVHDGFDTTTPQGQLQMHILSAFSEYFRKQLGSKVTGGMKERAKVGKPLGRIPFGYEIGENSYIIEPDEAQAVKLMYKWYLEDNVGIRGIATRLNASGIKTKSGNHWASHTVKVILRNEVYTGVFTWNDIRVEHAHPQIIDRDIFDKVQIRKQRKKKLGGRAQNQSYLLSGLLRCAHCGASMGGHIQRKRYNYRYYCCQAFVQKGTAVCPGGFLNAKTLEGRILSQLREIVNGLATAHQQVLIPTDLEDMREKLRLKERELERNQTMLTRAAEAYEAGEYDLAFFRARKASLSEQGEQLKQDIALIMAQIAGQLSQDELAKRLAVKKRYIENFLEETDMHKIKTGLQEYVDHIEVRSAEDITIHLRI